MAWTQQANIKGDTGATGATGAGGATGAAGAKGDTGDTGATGTRGAKWFTGSGAPTSVAGSIAGDFYLDTATGDVYVLS